MYKERENAMKLSVENEPAHGRVKANAFTLIELLVVIAIITILPVQNF